MLNRQAIQDAFRIIILFVGLFTCLSGFLCEIADAYFSPFDGLSALFGCFVLLSLLVTLVLQLCRLFRISFIARKGERIIAALYIVLSIISFRGICFLITFGFFANPLDAYKWLIVRRQIAIPFVVFCVLWLLIRCICLLVTGRSPLVKEEVPAKS